jgi:hypothetical protein
MSANSHVEDFSIETCGKKANCNILISKGMFKDNEMVMTLNSLSE